VLFYFAISKLVVYFNDTHSARVVGIYVYRSNYKEEFATLSIKLFNESYFDLMLSVPMNLIALVNYASQNEFEKLFQGPGNLINTVLLLIYVPLLLFYLLY
jgi:hypothetical protein